MTRWFGWRDTKACAIWTGWKPIAAGPAIGLAAFVATTVVVPALFLTKTMTSALHWAALVRWSVYAVNYSTFVGGPLTEEAGWRGFALPRLQVKVGPIAGTLVLAVLWAAWHAPMFLIPGWISSSPWEYVLILTGVSFLLTVALNLSRFSVIVAVLLHAFFNTSTRLLNALVAGLATRSRDNLIYTAVVFGLGTMIGVGVLARKHRPATVSTRANC